MSTYKELIYLVSDEMKNISDDSIINLEHIAFVLDKYRANMLKQYYSSVQRQVASSNYQTICINLEEVQDGICSCSYLRSKENIPYSMNIGSFVIDTGIVNNPYISFINQERFTYAGSSKYTSNTIYATIKNNKLLLKSNNSDFTNLEKIKVTAIFEDSLAASELSCSANQINSNSAICDPWDTEFPLESSLIPLVVEASLKELLGAILRPADSTNNADDDLSSLHNYIAKNAKSNLQKQIDGNSQ